MDNIKNLVFEAGGTKGIAFVGAVRALDEYDMLKNIENFAGSSAGSIVATLLSVGYSFKEMEDILWNMDFNNFKDSSYFELFNVIRFLFYYGWYRGNNFEEWIEYLIEKKTGKKDTTFSDLDKGLHLIASNISKRRFEVFSKENTPDVKISLAVRMSMSIPYIFKPVFYNDNIYIDGGIIMKYPIQIFDNELVPNPNTLGFRVDSLDRIDRVKNKEEYEPKKLGNFYKFTKEVIGTMVDHSNEAFLRQVDIDRTVFIDASGVKSSDFDIDNDTKTRLYDNGIKYTKKYLDSRIENTKFNTSFS